MMSDTSENLLAEAAAAYCRARHPLALTGAGISVESGIPDFRSDDGLWRKFDPAECATLEAFRRSPAKAWRFYRELGKMVAGSLPNPAHEALSELEHRGRLRAVITQNIDGLHQLAGSRRVIEVHGEHRHLHCLGCGWKRPVSQADYREKGIPTCQLCSRALKPNVVLFGELVRELDEVDREIQACDALLVIGTSAEVYPVAELPFRVGSCGGRIFEFNVAETALTRDADFTFRGKCAGLLPTFVRAVLATT